MLGLSAQAQMPCRPSFEYFHMNIQALSNPRTWTLCSDLERNSVLLSIDTEQKIGVKTHEQATAIINAVQTAKNYQEGLVRVSSPRTKL